MQMPRSFAVRGILIHDVKRKNHGKATGFFAKFV